MNNRVLLLTVAWVVAANTLAMSFETDRKWYLAGEAMQVSVNADNALIAYAELCDTHSLAAGVVIGLEDGKGMGTIELPSSLHSGYYVLSVYTRDNTQVSQRLVAIVNPLHKHADDDIEWIKTTHPDSLSHPQTGAEEKPDLVSTKEAGLRETEGHIIKARIGNVHEGHTFKGSDIVPSLSIIGKQIHYFEGKMINDSTAVFYTYGIHGRQPIVLSAVSSTGVSLPIQVISPFATLLPRRLPHLVFHYQRSEVETRSLDMQRHQMSTKDVMPSVYDEEVSGTKPDLTYNLDEYRQFLTVREVLLEYVNWVKRKTTNGVTRLIVHRELDSYDNTLPTLVLIDGMPVYDTERLLNYDARRIQYINIYSGQYTFGNGVYDGILSFVTRSGQLTNYPTERNAQYLVYGFPVRWAQNV